MSATARVVRFLVALFVIVVVPMLIFSTTTAQAAPAGDRFEPNDSRWSAEHVLPPWTSNSSSYDLEVSSGSDEDWFSFDTVEGGSVRVTVRADSWGLSCELYAPGNSALPFARGMTDNIGWESLYATAPSTGTYYLKFEKEVYTSDSPIKYRVELRAPSVTTLPPTTTTTLPPTTVPATGFTDVDASHPYHAAIDGMQQGNIIDGYPVSGGWEFRPNNLLWRAQFTKMICGVLNDGPPGNLYRSPFTDLGPDIPSDPYPHDYVAWAYAHDITQGLSATTFGPYTDITRAQVVTMIVRGAQSLKPGALANPPAGYTGSIPSFSDVHSPNMRMAEYNGLMAGLVGFGPGWDPWTQATRGEVAQMLWNLRQSDTESSPTTTTTPTTTSTTTMTLPPTTTTTLPPTTTTVPPRKLELTVLSHGFRTSWVEPSFGWVNLLTGFKLKNTGTVPLNVLFSVAGPFALDGSGNTIAGGLRTEVGPPSLWPGETGYYISNDLLTQDGLLPSQIVDVKLIPQPDEFAAAAARPVRRLTIDTFSKSVGDQVVLRASVRNDTSTTAEGVSGVIVLESGGAPIGGAPFYDSRAVSPGQSIQVETTMPIVVPAILADVMQFSGVAWTNEN